MGDPVHQNFTSHHRHHSHPIPDSYSKALNHRYLFQSAPMTPPNDYPFIPEVPPIAESIHG